MAIGYFSCCRSSPITNKFNQKLHQTIQILLLCYIQINFGFKIHRGHIQTENLKKYMPNTLIHLILINLDRVLV